MKRQMDDTRGQIARLRQEIVMAACAAGEGHIASAFSILEILWVLYRQVLKFDPLLPDAPDRDRFILSKGHGSLALYAMLADCAAVSSAAISCTIRGLAWSLMASIRGVYSVVKNRLLAAILLK